MPARRVHSSITRNVLFACVASWLYTLCCSLPLEGSCQFGPRNDDSRCILNKIDDMMNGVERETIKEMLRFLSSEPHFAGTTRDEELANMIRDKFEEYGLDSAELVEYETLLSFPNSSRPNEVSLLDENGNVIFTSKYQEEVMIPDEYSKDLVDAFFGFAPQGDATGKLLYVNYGREQDFELLKRMGIEINGTICIAKFGKIFRGSKVSYAEKYGAVGVVLYPDPIDYAQDGIDPKDVYPNTWWLTDSALQRGSVSSTHGDPQTPGWPSLKEVYRLKEDEIEVPKIPAQPIGYGDAQKLLKILGGKPAPPQWAGSLPGVEYLLGPGFNEANQDKTLRIVVNNYRQKIRFYNVIGKIMGSVEPDRYVIIGNHRDAWGFGAVDPSSGTASLLEAVRLFGLLKQQGCRPRRTILFGSWGAEEQGLIGSTEWVEEHALELTIKATATINLDTCVAGPQFRPKVSPFLWETFRQAMRKVKDPADPSVSLYDTWLEDQPPDPEGFEPEFEILKTMSDHVPFDFYMGIPSAMLKFFPTNEVPSNYPAYHTGYDTFNYVEKFLDPKFQYMEACARLSIGLVGILADTPLSPLNSTDASIKMSRSIIKMIEAGYEQKLNHYGTSLKPLENQIASFRKASELWQSKAAKSDLSNPLITRMLSDQTASIQKAFVLPQGLPDRPLTRNAVFSPSLRDGYGSTVFPSISDLLDGIDDLPEEAQRQRVQQLQKHMSDLQILIHQATDLLSVDDLPTTNVDSTEEYKTTTESLYYVTAT